MGKAWGHSAPHPIASRPPAASTWPIGPSRRYPMNQRAVATESCEINMDALRRCSFSLLSTLSHPTWPPTLSVPRARSLPLVATMSTTPRSSATPCPKVSSCSQVFPCSAADEPWLDDPRIVRRQTATGQVDVAAEILGSRLKHWISALVCPAKERSELLLAAHFSALVVCHLESS